MHKNVFFTCTRPKYKSATFWPLTYILRVKAGTSTTLSCLWIRIRYSLMTTTACISSEIPFKSHFWPLEVVINYGYQTYRICWSTVWRLTFNLFCKLLCANTKRGITKQFKIVSISLTDVLILYIANTWYFTQLNAYKQ